MKPQEHDECCWSLRSHKQNRERDNEVQLKSDTEDGRKRTKKEGKSTKNTKNKPAKWNSSIHFRGRQMENWRKREGPSIVLLKRRFSSLLLPLLILYCRVFTAVNKTELKNTLQFRTDISSHLDCFCTNFGSLLLLFSGVSYFWASSSCFPFSLKTPSFSDAVFLSLSSCSEWQSARSPIVCWWGNFACELT